MIEDDLLAAVEAAKLRFNSAEINDGYDVALRRLNDLVLRGKIRDEYK